MKKRDTTAEQLLEMRLSGQMPTIDIAGNAFQVQWSDQVLVLENDKGGRIALDDMALDEDGRNYLCFFHLPTSSAISIPEDIVTMPKDTVMLIIPTEPYIDPVGLARKYGLPESYMLDTYPIRKDLKAEVLTLEETGLGKLIQANREKKRTVKNSFRSFFKIGGSRKKRNRHGKAH